MGPTIARTRARASQLQNGGSGLIAQQELQGISERLTSQDDLGRIEKYGEISLADKRPGTAVRTSRIFARV